MTIFVIACIFTIFGLSLELLSDWDELKDNKRRKLKIGVFLVAIVALIISGIEKNGDDKVHHEEIASQKRHIDSLNDLLQLNNIALLHLSDSIIKVQTTLLDTAISNLQAQNAGLILLQSNYEQVTGGDNKPIVEITPGPVVNTWFFSLKNIGKTPFRDLSFSMHKTYHWNTDNPISDSMLRF